MKLPVQTAAILRETPAWPVRRPSTPGAGLGVGCLPSGPWYWCECDNGTFQWCQSGQSCDLILGQCTCQGGTSRPKP
jgi:hypothetical protein